MLKQKLRVEKMSDGRAHARPSDATDCPMGSRCCSRMFGEKKPVALKNGAHLKNGQHIWAEADTTSLTRLYLWGFGLPLMAFFTCGGAAAMAATTPVYQALLGTVGGGLGLVLSLFIINWFSLPMCQLDIRFKEEKDA